jgi:hypothetical protein
VPSACRQYQSAARTRPVARDCLVLLMEVTDDGAGVRPLAQEPAQDARHEAGRRATRSPRTHEAPSSRCSTPWDSRVTTSRVLLSAAIPSRVTLKAVEGTVERPARDRSLGDVLDGSADQNGIPAVTLPQRGEEHQLLELTQEIRTRHPFLPTVYNVIARHTLYTLPGCVARTSGILERLGVRGRERTSSQNKMRRRRAPHTICQCT